MQGTASYISILILDERIHNLKSLSQPVWHPLSQPIQAANSPNGGTKGTSHQTRLMVQYQSFSFSTARAMLVFTRKLQRVISSVTWVTHWSFPLG